MCFATRRAQSRSEEHTSELQSHSHLVCRLLLEKKNNTLRLQTKKAEGKTRHTHDERERAPLVGSPGVTFWTLQTVHSYADRRLLLFFLKDPPPPKFPPLPPPPPFPI